MAPRLQFLNPDGTPSDAIYCQSDDPLVWTETVPPSKKKTLSKLVLDHRTWAALRRGELNELFTLLPALRELILPVADWGELDTYIGTLQFTRLNKDRVVYHGEDVHTAPLDKFEYDTWAEFKDELLAMGGDVLTPGDLRREVAEVVDLAFVGTAVDEVGRPVDTDGKGPKITIVGCRRVEQES